MRKNWVHLIGLLVILALAVSACAPAAPAPTATPAPAKTAATAPATSPAATPAVQATQPPKAATQPWEKELKIATIFGTTGPVAGWTAAPKNGMDMAIEEINKAGGVAGRTLSLQHFDPGSDATQAANLTRQASDWALISIGPITTFNARGAVPVGNQLGLPMIVTSSVLDLLKQNRPWAFGVLADPETMGRRGVKAFVKKEPSVKKVVLITDFEDPATGAQAKGVETGTKQNDLQLLDTIPFKTGDIDFTAQVTKAKGLRPDAILLSAQPNELGGLIREIRRQGITAPLYSTQTGWNPPTIRKIAAQALEGVYAGIEWCSCDPTSQKFVKGYEERFKEPVSQGAIMYYDMIHLVKAAFEGLKLTGDPAKLKDERVKLRDFLTDPKGWSGAYGKWSWDKDGMPTRPGVFIQVQNDKEVQLAELAD